MGRVTAAGGEDGRRSPPSPCASSNVPSSPYLTSGLPTQLLSPPCDTSHVEGPGTRRWLTGARCARQVSLCPALGAATTPTAANTPIPRGGGRQDGRDVKSHQEERRGGGSVWGSPALPARPVLRGGPGFAASLPWEVPAASGSADFPRHARCAGQPASTTRCRLPRARPGFSGLWPAVCARLPGGQVSIPQSPGHQGSSRLQSGSVQLAPAGQRPGTESQGFWAEVLPSCSETSPGSARPRWTWHTLAFYMIL